jgi:hypothetical protein
MLRGPFVRLFGPLLGSRQDTSKHQSYQLSAQRKSASAATNHRNDIYQSHEFERSDSEEGIVRDDANSDRKANPRSRRGSGIFVTNEFSVVTSGEKRKSQARSDGLDGDTLATTRSVNEDKPDGKSPYFHI